MAPAFYRFGDWEFTTSDLTLRCRGRRVSLTHQSARVLHYLIVNRDRTVRRSELIEQFWTLDSIGSDDRLNTCVRRIRSALGDAASEGSMIETRPRVGYRFVAEIEEAEQPIAIDVIRSRTSRYWRTGIAVATALLGAGIVWFTSPQPGGVVASESVYRNDGYTLRKNGALRSSCDFAFEGGPGQCTISGDGLATFSYKTEFLLRIEVTPERDVQCELDGGKVFCG